MPPSPEMIGDNWFMEIAEGRWQQSPAKPALCHLSVLAGKWSWGMGLWKPGSLSPVNISPVGLRRVEYLLFSTLWDVGVVIVTGVDLSAILDFLTLCSGISISEMIWNSSSQIN